jgi:hypothetical protein
MLSSRAPRLKQFCWLASLGWFPRLLRLFLSAFRPVGPLSFPQTNPQLPQLGTQSVLFYVSLLFYAYCHELSFHFIPEPEQPEQPDH